MSAFLDCRRTREQLLRKSFSYFIFLDDMKNIVRHSFLVHKSVSYLDLNLSEYSSSKHDENHQVYNRKTTESLILKRNFICTQESSRKDLAKNRSVLYTYHLDSSDGLESNQTILDGLESNQTKLEKECSRQYYYFNGVLLNGILVPSGLYERRLNEMIIAHLSDKPDVKFVKRVLKIIKFVPLFENSVFLLIRCLEFFFQCGDSDIDEFSATVRLKESDMLFVKPEILEIYLRHGGCKDCNDREFHRRQEWINYCLSAYKFEHVAPLLKFHNVPRFSPDAYNKTKNSLKISCALTEEEMEKPVELGWITRERNLLCLQILDIYYSSAFPLLENSSLQCKGFEALRLVWSSIPDILISSDELLLLYGDTRIRRDIKRIHRFYSRIVREGALLSQPRKLKDYCCVMTRKILCENQRLPEGISQLGFPIAVQSFLKLERTWLK